MTHPSALQADLFQVALGVGDAVPQPVAAFVIAAEVFGAADDPHQIRRRGQGPEQLKSLDLAAARFGEHLEPDILPAPLGSQKIRVGDGLLTGEDYHFRCHGWSASKGRPGPTLGRRPAAYKQNLS